MQANSEDPDQTPHSVASDLGLHYLPMSHKKDARHIWVKVQLLCLSHKSCRNLGSTLTQNENFTQYSKVYILMIKKVSGLIFSVIESSMPYRCL